jgi:predicted Holliday junction resolvase-like endonuclease
MTGIWLVSYVILWVLVLAGAVALLALARELVALQREVEMAKYQLAHKQERVGACRCEQASEPCLPQTSGAKLEA